LTIDFQINTKKIKNKKIISIYFSTYRLMVIQISGVALVEQGQKWSCCGSNFIQFHYHLIFHQGLSKFYIICNNYNLTVFDGQSNDNEII
jgi:2',3'-cyclic-nucleotide 2'-phosphodiesterase (5'-nucleotidase family)